MLSHKNEFKNLENHYYQVLRKLTKIKTEPIAGRLDYSGRYKKYQYYHTSKDPITNKTKRVYIGVDDLDLARKLAQQSYNENVEKLLLKRLSQLRDLNSDYKVDEIQKIYEDLHPARKRLVKPILQSPSQALKKWRSIPYSGRGFSERDPKFYTNKNERVRSKTEKILADYFYYLGIEYKYECPVRLSNGKIYYPDFTFYDPYNNREIYWEHHGMLDDEDYAKQTIIKIQNYEMSGIFRGERLIISYESSTEPLNMKWVEEMVKKYLLDIRI